MLAVALFVFMVLSGTIRPELRAKYKPQRRLPANTSPYLSFLGDISVHDSVMKGLIDFWATGTDDHLTSRISCARQAWCCFVICVFALSQSHAHTQDITSWLSLLLIPMFSSYNIVRFRALKDLA